MKARRLFIDCSFVDFGRQPTGIPRVVLKYVENGYAWGLDKGVDVVPVVTTTKGLFPVRPLPGANPPASTVGYTEPAVRPGVDGTSAAAHLRAAEDALRAALIDAGAPAGVAGIEAGVSSLFSRLASQDDEEGLKIDVAPGDVIFYPAYWHDIDPLLFVALRKQGAKVFILVHDILPITHAKFYQTPWRERFADNLLAVIGIADGMIAVSRYTADCVKTFAAENNVRLQHIDVLHNGFDHLIEDEDLRRYIEQGRHRPSFARKRTYDFFLTNQPYIMVGSIEPKKGHVPVIKSFEALWRRGLDRKLVLVGRRGWMEEKVVDQIERSEFFGDKLFWFDNMDDMDLYCAYTHSRALIFSSYAEGFGIPMIEASMSKLPLVCYDTDITREVAGTFGLFYSDFEGFRDHIASLEDDETRDRLKADLDGFSWPSWEETGRRLFDRLDAIVGR